MSCWDPPRLVGDDGCCWFSDSGRTAHLIWFQQKDDFVWDVRYKYDAGEWHPTKRWVCAHGPQLPLGKSWANWEWKEDSTGGVAWRLRFVMGAEEGFADEQHELFGTVSLDGAEITFEEIGSVWSRAGHHGFA